MELMVTLTVRDAGLSPRQRRLMGWFGIRGIGSIYYLMFAINQGLARPLAELSTTEWDRGNAHFPPTTFQVSNFHAGTGVVTVGALITMAAHLEAKSARVLRDGNEIDVAIETVVAGDVEPVE